jgi:trehalose synthase
MTGGLLRVETPPRDWRGYGEYLNAGQHEAVCALANQLRGCRIVHLNATARGGGVAEMLEGLVPLLCSFGLDAEWYVLPPHDEFFAITKRLHNALQGRAEGLSASDWTTYLHVLEQIAHGMQRLSADVWVIHDPQPLPLGALANLSGGSLWRCHLDCSAPNARVASRLLPWVQAYDRAIFSYAEYVFQGLASAQVGLEFPAIDPLAPKNRPLRRTTALAILAGLGLDPRRPLVTQVSRFDPWKNPWQAVDIYRLAKRRLPGLQLALVGVFSAKDDPEGPQVYESVRRYAHADPDIHLFTDPVQVAEREVNAFQTASMAILQRSTREGFGLVVTEAMWKARPVIGTPVGGIVSQIDHGQTGVLATDPAECADWLVRLAEDASLATRLGRAARESVRTRFLLPRLVHDELGLYSAVSGSGAAAVAAERAA